MFRVLAEHNDWRLIGFDDKHFPDKRWLLDVIATFNPGADIFRKDYLPPVKASKLSEIKSIEVPLDFIRGLPLSQRKNRRKGLHLQKEGLRAQKKERFKLMQKKYANALLEEEVKEDERQSKARQSIRSATNEATFKEPSNNATPTRRHGGSNIMSSGSRDALNTSASSFNVSSIQQFSPGMDQRMNELSIANDNSSKKKRKSG